MADIYLVYLNMNLPKFGAHKSNTERDISHLLFVYQFEMKAAILSYASTCLCTCSKYFQPTETKRIFVYFIFKFKNDMFKQCQDGILIK